MSRFKVGDRVYLQGVVERIDSEDGDYPIKVAFATEGDFVWCRFDAPIIPAHNIERHDLGLLPAYLEERTKERDDAREQLARVCAQVETLGAELKHERAEVERLRNMMRPVMEERDHARRDRDDMSERLEREREQYARACGLLEARATDTRVLDVIGTLLGMRER